MVGGTLPEFSLTVWHGVNTPLIMSFVALVGGIALYTALRLLRKNGSIDDAVLVLQHINGKRIFDNVLARISLLAKHLRRALTTYRLQWQMLWLVSIALLSGFMPLWIRGLDLAIARPCRCRPPSWCCG